MNKKMISALLLAALTSIATYAQNDNALEGFEYGKAVAPDGAEWQAPTRLGYNKLQPRAWFVSFANAEEARKVLPEYSSRRISLDGTWKFHFAKTPEERPANFFQPGFDCTAWDDITVPSNWNMVGIQKDGSQKYGTPIYVNQPVIFYHQVKKDDWREGVMRTPPTNWTTYEYRNEVGSYRRTFSIPKNWKGQEMFVEFDGVDSFFYLWVNGQYVGFSKNSRDAARFDITRFAHVGENSISVEVYRNSDGSLLEAQDMFRLPGIYRSVSVYTTPKVHIQDIRANAMWTGSQATLSIETQVKNHTGYTKDHKVVYSLYRNKLYSDENELVAGPTSPADLLSAVTIKPWTAEEPNIYVLVAELKDKKGRTTEAVSTQIGFRTVQILETEAENDEFGLAGRYFYINGQPLKLKGVNRHETNPERGHAITRQQMEEEVMMMKRANINHVRTSHYSNAPYFYYLCNRYGIYLEAEANLESHEYHYGEASLSHPIEWQPAHIARMMELAHARVNDPCIVLWSLGNEAGPGDNFKASYAAVKAFDPSRPVQYERNNDIVDIGSDQYPSVGVVQARAKGITGEKFPFHISEYAHSMGNAVGNLQDYWNAIESSNFIMGGAIWDWIDQSMYNYTKDGQRYLAYGGDFGDTPNDGQFVMNGIIFGDLEPKPQYYEVKKVYQNMAIQWDDVCSASIDIFNKNYYTDDLSDYDCYYQLIADGKVVKSGRIDVGSVKPRTHKCVTIDDVKLSELNDEHEYFVNIEFRLKHDMPWAKAGYIQANEQLVVKAPISTAGPMPREGLISCKEENDRIEITGDGFSAVFNSADGSIYHLNYGDQKVFEDGCGPQLDAFRAWVNNDNWAYQNWYANGLHNLKHQADRHQVKKNSDGTLSVVFTIESQAPYGARLEGADRNWKRLVELTEKSFGPADFRFKQDIVYTIFPDGSIQVEAAITSNNPQLVLPRLGYVMKTPTSMQNFRYYGRGPIDNYPDRKTSQPIGIYNNKVSAEVENFPKPQDMANHQDTRWCSLSDDNGQGAIFIGNKPMSVSVLPWSAQQLAMANHPHELPVSTGNWLHLDLAVTGLGGNSCGQGGPLDPDRVKASPHLFSFMIRPLKAMNHSSDYRPAFVGEVPLLITRDASGLVSITSAKREDGIYQEIYYKILPKDATDKQLKSIKPLRYVGPFNLREGGTVIACNELSNKGVFPATVPVFSQVFDKIDRVPVTIKFASSVESGEGDAEHLVDGNPDTFWHTMWSVTVANYPHWVDFDCGTVKSLKGFSYLPRQDSRNGNIKQYRIQVSQDGVAWGDPICEGAFENNQKEKSVLFSTPVKARYLRFTALSSQDGQDFATGAEFAVLEE